MNRYKLHEPRPVFNYSLKIGSRVIYSYNFTQEIILTLRGEIIEDNGSHWGIHWDNELTDGFSASVDKEFIIHE